jgi:hypothetical protein
MDTEEVKELFKQFYDQTINLYGLVIFLDNIEMLKDKTYDFNFTLSNPNDVSYYDVVITEELIPIVDEFCNYLNIAGHPHLIGLSKRLYLSKELKNKIEYVFKKVKFLEFDSTYKTPYNKEVERNFKIYIDHVKVDINYNYDSILINNVVKPTYATLNGGHCDVKNALYAYNDFLSDKETYYETEKYYIEIDSIISDNPLVSDHYVAQYYHTVFI